MSRDNSHPLLARLSVVLDTYGTRQERWPQAERPRLAAFIETDAAAAKLFAEARALDNVLTFAPRHGRAEALEARILVAAASLPQTGQSAGAVIAFPRRPESGPSRGQTGGNRDRMMWPEMTLLAASLFLGLMIGLSGQAVPALQDIAVIAGEESTLGSLAGLLFDPGAPPGQGAL
jgi:hypothetical protein